MKNYKAKYLVHGLAVATTAILVACDNSGGLTATTDVVIFKATCTDGKTMTSMKSQADAEAICAYLTSPPPKLAYPNPNKTGYGASK